MTELPDLMGAKPVPGAEVVFDGTRTMLDAKWTYWQGPGFSSSLPIKWQIVPDPAPRSVAGASCCVTGCSDAFGGSERGKVCWAGE